MADSDFLRTPVLVFLVLLAVGYFRPNAADTLINGGRLSGKQKTVYTASNSPYVVMADLKVEKDATLEIEPGVTMKFHPRVGLDVEGTLIARGTADKRITLTKYQIAGSDYELSSELRLVDSWNITHGRLQMYHKGKWRGICMNYRNWNPESIQLACRSMGYLTGNFTFERIADNETYYMLLEDPKCDGSEQSLMECPGTKDLQIGKHICVNQITVGLDCYGADPILSENYWRGLTFFNSSIRAKSRTQNVSASVLEFVDIMFAGVNSTRNFTAALSASPNPPYLDNCRIMRNGFDGVNFTEVRSEVIIRNSEIAYNRGYGVNVTSFLGDVQVDGTDIHDNYGEGMRARLLDGQYYFYQKEDTFCLRTIFQTESFPLLMPGVMWRDPACRRPFRTVRGQYISINLLESQVLHPSVSGSLTIYDGEDENFPVLARWDLKNNTFYQGVTSHTNVIYVVFDWVSHPSCKTDLTQASCIKFTIYLTAGKEISKDFSITNSQFTQNVGRGLSLENPRNMIYVNNTNFTFNMYDAGFRVLDGASDIVINASRFQYNDYSSINITYCGGHLLLNGSTVTHNDGRGMTTHFLKGNKTRIEKNHTVEVVSSKFEYNKGFSVFFGNYCEAGYVRMNRSGFAFNSEDAVFFESCYLQNAKSTNFTMTFNRFQNNEKMAVRMTPALNVYGKMSNNSFVNNLRGVILIDNTYLYVLSREYRTLPVSYDIIHNTFQSNTGWFVANMRLTENSGVQALRFKYNRLENNKIIRPFPGLNPRSRAPAVVVISSANIEFKRNYLYNPLSLYEVTSHLLEPSVTIDVTLNYWKYLKPDGEPKFADIVPRIFDNQHRYDLAKFKYNPALKTPELYSNFITQEPDYYTPFKNGNSIGGLLNENTNQNSKNAFLTEGEYIVERDIIVPTESRLILRPGVVLHFANSVGMLVKGKLTSTGTATLPIMYRMYEEPVVNNTVAKNATVSPGPEIKVRLTGGPNQNEGLVEVYAEGLWGTVCNKGWTRKDAAIVCQELGMSLHPDDWLPETKISGAASQPIWRSQVDCDDWATTLLTCKADGRYDHSCDHTLDVNLRCKPLTWAGVRFTVQAQASAITFSEFRAFGLLDYARTLYSPALQIDYNVHQLSNLLIENGVSHGMTLVHSDPYNIRQLEKITSRYNLKSGLLAKGPFMTIKNAQLSNNGEAGFKYDSKFTEKDVGVLRSLMVGQGSVDIMAYTTQPLVISDQQTTFVYCSPNSTPENKIYDIQVTTGGGFQVSVQILDYNPVETEEHVIFFEGTVGKTNGSLRNWTIHQDLVDFPMPISNRLIIRFEIEGLRSGRFAAILKSVPSQATQSIGEITLQDSVMAENGLGIYTIHYNDPSNEFFDLFFRYRREKFLYHNVRLLNNKYHALYIPSITKYHESFMPTYAEMEGSARLSEILYSIQSSLITGNGKGIVGDHNHVEFSNNVWHWEVTNNQIVDNKNGGFMIELPLVGRGFSMKDKNLEWYQGSITTPDVVDNPYDPTLKYRDGFWVHNHTIWMNNTVFENNKNFEFRIAGYYANSSLYNNTFRKNNCRKGLVTIAGMEKQMDVISNTFMDNIGRYVFEYDIHSHYEYAVKVDGMFKNNNLKRNKIPSMLKTIPGQPTTYALAIRGVENITVHRNLFKNNLQFEFLAGTTSSFLESYLDARYNYWGTSDQFAVRKLIFDFDDWNNYAMALFYPFLVSDSFTSAEDTAGLLDISLDITKPLGGRVKTQLVLPYRSTPYEVISDLTVMPQASLTIAPGVRIEFAPNIGILALGPLNMVGTWDKPIKLWPRKTSTRKKRAWNDPILKTKLKTRLVGGKIPNEGFVEFFNETAQRWELVCDNQFNDKVGRAVCQHMGMAHENVVVRNTKYYDYALYGYDKRTVKFFWRYSYFCSGDEDSLDECVERYNYKLYQCVQNQGYVFLRCALNNLGAGEKYWGNIRFASPDVEKPSPSDYKSVLKHVQIYGAGNLHGERVAAIQATHEAPRMSHMSTKNCAWNAYDFVAPRYDLYLANSTMENNLGYGVGVLVLNGESRDSPKSSFRPLNESTLPYNTFGLVRMCGANKDMVIENRFLLHYKYDYKSAACIKVIRSRIPMKQIAVRFLQVDLFHDNFSKNAIELFNGDKSANMSNLIVSLTSDSTEDQKRMKYATRPGMDVMSIHIHASPARGSYGFIAEVVTLPLSPLSYPITGRDQLHKFGDLRHIGNQGSFMKYQSVGEINPNIEIQRNYIKDNGIKVLNLTAPPMIDMFVQNNWRMDLANNYIYSNKGGGIFLYTYSLSQASGLTGNVTNNFVDSNSYGEALHIEGTQYQKVKFAYNYFGHNDVEHRNVMFIKDVAINMTRNVIYENVGAAIMNISSLKDVGSYQLYQWNSFYKNKAIGKVRTTVFAQEARQVLVNNFFFNEQNDFELATSNASRLPKLAPDKDDQKYPYIGPDGKLYNTPEPPFEDSRIEAIKNWWGSHLDVYIKGRIWDRDDDRYLVPVDYKPFYASNSSVLDGLCPPGWSLHDERCFLYMGGAVPFEEARMQCKHENGKLADSYKAFDFLRAMIIRLQTNYDEFVTRVWVYYTGNASPGRCTVIRHWWHEKFDCEALLPFICEKNPYLPPMFDWVPVWIAIGCIGGLLILVIIFGIFWSVKTKRRQKERFERRSSIRSSIKSNRTASQASLGSIGGTGKRQRNGFRPAGTPDTISKVLTVSGMTLDATSTDSIDKIKYNNRNGTPSASTLDYPDSARHSGFFEPSEFEDPYSPRLENEIANIHSRPMYDTVFENRAYDERSVERHRRRPPSMAMMEDIDLDMEKDVKDTDSYSSSGLSTFKKPLSTNSSTHKDLDSYDSRSNYSDARSTDSSRRPPRPTDM
ncbi:protein bark beetle-like isoform X2 [Lineus longissimus]|uniref:protein bark beetle-like isoform X2 n=1 Tax=Lineus longissimus TaxID=88925 RepID=UPI002B4C675F